MRERINSSRRFRPELANLDGHGDCEIPRPSDDEVATRPVRPPADAGDAAPEPHGTEHPSEHWYG